LENENYLELDKLILPNNMKNKFLKYFTYMALMISLVAASSCNWVDPDLNTDPDSPTDVYCALILPAAEANLGYTYQGFDYAGITGMWLQYFEGTDRQAVGMYNYLYTSDDCNNFYGSLYYGVMMDCHKIIEKSSVPGKENPHLKGMAQVLMAVSLGTATGVWGDIPYSTAFQGDADLKPTFDSEESIYAAIQDLLDEAITNLSSDATDYEEKYISNMAQDLIYGGSYDTWIKAAYTLKARYALRLSQKGATYFNVDDCLSWLANGISSKGEDFRFNFYDASYYSSNPLFEYYWERYGYTFTNGNFTGMLENTGDPRIVVFQNDPYDYYWAAGGYALGYASSPCILTSYFESKFIEAECQLIKKDSAAAAAAYNEAVYASLDKWGLTTEAGITQLDDNFAMFGNDPSGLTEEITSDWLDANAVETESSISLEKIITGKYIAMYAEGESWFDFRRHGNQYPALTPPADNTTNNVFPESYLYPTTEKVTNDKNVPQRGTVTSKLWAISGSK
jgi:hypothetical protein